jgi:hypothetical protein
VALVTGLQHAGPKTMRDDMAIGGRSLPAVAAGGHLSRIG